MFFYFVELFRCTHFAAFSTFSREIFDFFRLVLLFSHSAQSPFKQQLLSKAIQNNDESQYKKIKVRNRNGMNP